MLWLSNTKLTFNLKCQNIIWPEDLYQPSWYKDIIAFTFGEIHISGSLIFYGALILIECQNWLQSYYNIKYVASEKERVLIEIFVYAKCAHKSNELGH